LTSVRDCGVLVIAAQATAILEVVGSLEADVPDISEVDVKFGSAFLVQLAAVNAY
jgi:hypothetical protein